MSEISHRLRVALVQADFLVGAVRDNARRMMESIARARDEAQADLVLFPELALSGCPAQDWWRCTHSLAACRDAVEEMARAAVGIVAVVGWPQWDAGRCYDALSVLRDGRIAATYRKRQLAGADAVDESRYFTADGTAPPCVFAVRGVQLGVLLGSELDCTALLAQTLAAGADVVLVAAAAVFVRGQHAQRAAQLAGVARSNSVPLAWLNLAGAQDALVFAGASLLADADGHIHPPAVACDDTLLVADLFPARRGWTPVAWKTDGDASDTALLWRALTRSISDYCRNNGFSRVWLGVSGGIDSALVLALAVDALGAEQVSAVRLPSRYTSDLSNDLAQAQCAALGVAMLTLPIERAFAGFVETLAEPFAGRAWDVTEENLQSRVRGSLMMALANKFGGLLLATGNKSEFAVGYATIYGDMCGGFAPLKDVYKTDVYALARWRNAQGAQPVIPLEVIARAPSAELRGDQRDEDSLPPYAVLDAILFRHIEQHQSAAEIIAAGFAAETVQRVLHLVRSSEWKRQQAAPGPKVSTRAFGIDWRWPISCRNG